MIEWILEEGGAKLLQDNNAMSLFHPGGHLGKKSTQSFHLLFVNLKKDGAGLVPICLCILCRQCSPIHRKLSPILKLR